MAKKKTDRIVTLSDEIRLNEKRKRLIRNKALEKAIKVVVKVKTRLPMGPRTALNEAIKAIRALKEQK